MKNGLTAYVYEGSSKVGCAAKGFLYLVKVAF